MESSTQLPSTSTAKNFEYVYKYWYLKNVLEYEYFYKFSKRTIFKL